MSYGTNSLDDANDNYPDVFSDRDEEEINPVIIAAIGQVDEFIAKLKAGMQMTECAVDGEFTDDHIACYNMSATVDGKQYKFSAWCVGPEFGRDFVRASTNAKCHDRIVKYITE